VERPTVHAPSAEERAAATERRRAAAVEQSRVISASATHTLHLQKLLNFRVSRLIPTW